MGEVVPMKPPDGEGPDSPTLAYRVARLADDMREVKTSLRAIETRLTGIEVTLARIDGRLTWVEGRLQAIPTSLQLMTMLITTWTVGAGIVFAVIRFIQS